MTTSAAMGASPTGPPQAGQAPNGLLNENSRGSISGSVKPETGQANFSENTIRRASDAAAAASLVSFLPLAAVCSLPPCGGGLGRGGDVCVALSRLPPS